MVSLSSKQRKVLEKHAQSLPAVVLIGGGGVTDSVIAQIENAVSANELVKIKFNEFKDEKVELSNRISQSIDAVLVRIIGNTAVFYRPARQSGDRRFEKELKKASV
ncbi:MAG: YhbY family RNA-binding protein [Treponema sp.]|nr:YhbY family RNA-binding protein [Treponema sp.]